MSVRGGRATPSHAYRKVVEKAIASGKWEYAGIDGQHHGIIRHIPTGKTEAYQISNSGGDMHGVRNLAKRIEKVSGINVWDRGSRKPSRKRMGGSGYSDRQSEYELEQSRYIQQILTELEQVDSALISVMPEGRRQLPYARRLAVRRVELADELRKLHQPVPDLEVL